MRKIMPKEQKQQDKSSTGSLVEDIKENFGIDVEKIAETVIKNTDIEKITETVAKNYMKK